MFPPRSPTGRCPYSVSAIPFLRDASSVRFLFAPVHRFLKSRGQHNHSSSVAVGPCALSVPSLNSFIARTKKQSKHHPLRRRAPLRLHRTGRHHHRVTVLQMLASLHLLRIAHRCSSSTFASRPAAAAPLREYITVNITVNM